MKLLNHALALCVLGTASLFLFQRDARSETPSGGGKQIPHRVFDPVRNDVRSSGSFESYSHDAARLNTHVILNGAAERRVRNLISRPACDKILE